MANFKEIKNELIKFGLSENQALIYLLLIQHGELKIQEIVNLTQIPRSSVYDNLKVLEEFGLIEKVLEGKFAKIKPYPLRSIGHHVSEKLTKLESQIAKIDHLEKAIALLPKNSQQQTVVRYYKGVSGARQLLWNTLAAKDTIHVYSAWGRGRYVGIKFYKSFVSESRDRGFKEKVLINPSKRVLESIQKYSGTSVGRTVPENIRAIAEEDVLIKGETFIYGNIFAQLYLREEEINGFEIESANFTETQRSIFKTLWNRAEPLANYLKTTSQRV